MSSRVINLGSSNNAALLQLYANANVVPPISTTIPNSRFILPNVPNGRLPPKVTQSRSIFMHNERTVYGNPKDVLISPKYHTLHPHQQSQQRSQQYSQMSNDIGQGGVLDLTQKSNEKSTFPRPSLEIVRVPVVPRPNPLNLEVRNLPAAKDKPTLDRSSADCSKRVSFPAYQNVIDSRTIASNNLEITLVNPKQKNNHHPNVPSHVQIPSPPNKNNAMGTISSAQRRQQQHQVNGKYATRNEPISPYTPRKPSHPVIPNVPNLNHLNHSGNSFPRMQATTMQQQQQQQMSIDRRKTAAEAGRDHQHRRISESEKSSLTAQQQQESRQSEAGRRHSLPSIPSGFVPAVSQNNSAAYSLPQLPNAPGKFLPILDPMYYSAFYNGLFPPPIPPTATAAATSPFLPPEFSAYYKELLVSSQPRLTGITGQPPYQQPAAPTSK